MIRRLVLVATATLGVISCGGDSIVAIPLGGSGSRVSARVGQEIDISVGSVGPGEYSAPPTISSAAVRYVDVEIVGPFVPAGVRQRFRFTAAAPGQAVIRFVHTGSNPIVVDTVDVR